MENFDEDLVVDLECPVCCDYMSPPIHQCVEGHSICNKCFLKVFLCPTCRSPLSEESRNFALENIFEKVVLPCKNRDNGCNELQLGRCITHHQKSCKLEPKECPLKIICKCKWYGPGQELKHHCQERHHSNFITEPKYDIFYPNCSSRRFSSGYNFYIFNVHGEFFRCAMVVNFAKCYMRWCVVLLGKSDAHFEFRIEILNSFDAQKNIVLSSSCPHLLDSNYLDLNINKYLVADYDDLKCLSDSEDITITICINKV